MTDLHFILANLWFILIAVLIAVYFVLDGFDLGAGVLSPFLGKSEADKSSIYKAVGPYWDGNEVWLLTAGGALFAAFAPAYATSFSGFYLPIMLVLFGLIARAVAVELRHHDPKLMRVYDVAFFIGSLIPALLFGVAIGNIFQGIPMNQNGDYTGGFLALLNPFALLCGVLGLSQFLLQGAAWLTLKAPAKSGLRTKAAGARFILLYLNYGLFAITTALVFSVVNPTMASGAPEILRYIFAVVYVLSFVLARVGMVKKQDLWVFLSTSVMAVALVGLFAATIFPNIIPASPGSTGAAITVVGAASSELALTAMTVIAGIGLPLVIVYQIIIYRIFRGRVELQSNS